MRRTDQQRISGREVLGEAVTRATIRPPQHATKTNQRDGDYDRSTESLGNHVVKERTHNRRRHRGEQVQPCKATVRCRCSLLFRGERMTKPGQNEPGQLLAYCNDHCHQRAQMKCSVERSAHRLVVEIVPVEQPRHQLQVSTG